MKIKKITKAQLNTILKEEVEKQKHIKTLEKRKNELESILKENYPGVGTENGELGFMPQQTQTMEQPQSQQQGKPNKVESIFDARPNETVILNFDGVTIKVKRQLDDLFKIVDAAESSKLEEGDYIRIKGNDVLQPGAQFKFSVLREIPAKYETKALKSWKIIKN